MFSKRPFFLGVFCLALLSKTSKAFTIRKKPPDAVPRSILKNGCFPSSKVCPIQMYCLIDLQYPMMGQCACVGFHSKQLSPPKNNGSELAPPLRGSDCKFINSTTYLALFSYFLMAILHFRLMVGCAMIMYRVAKSGGASMNSSFLALIGHFISSFGFFVRCVQFFLVRANWDPHWYFFDLTYSYQFLFGYSFGYWFRSEIICTWFDLFQKSTNLSKRSSVLVKFLRTFIKIWGIVVGTLNAVAALDLLPRQAGDYHLILSSINLIQLPFFIIANAIIAPLLIRILCKDMRNVTHPNWKSAAAIRRVAVSEVAMMAINFPLMYAFVEYASSWAHQGNIIGNALYIPHESWVISANGEWFCYMLYVHRKRMNANDTARISRYFGFSTLGLNGSISSEMISKISSMTSSISSSVEEEEDEK